MFIISFFVLVSSVLEQYSYMLFAFLLPVFSKELLNNKLEMGYLILLISAFFRPLGAFFIGKIADNYSKFFALFLAAQCMTISCILMKNLTYFSTPNILFWLIFIRILQTISIGGEHNLAALFLVESFNGSKKKLAGTASGVAYFFSMMGTFLATFAAYYFSQNWKKAFDFGIILGLFSFFLRIITLKFPIKKTFLEQEESSSLNIYQNFMAAVLISASMSGLFYYNVVFFPNLFLKTIGYEGVKLFSTYYLIIYSIFLLIFGILYDFFKKKHYFLLIPSIFIFFNAIFSIYFQSLTYHFLNIIALSCFVGPSHAILFNLFSKKNRYAFASLGYSLGSSIMGASTPYFCSILIKYNVFFPSIWAMFLSFLGIMGAFLYKKALKI